MSVAGAILDTPARRGETLFAWSVFPLAIFGSLAIAIAIFDRGGSGGWAFGLGMLFGYGIVIAGERLYPHVSDWNRNHDDFATDAAWGASIVASGPLLGPVSGAVGAWAGSLLSARVDAPLWPTEWPLAGQLALALIVVEFFQYWMHRLQHETDLLWRFHATHHSAPRLYWLNAARFHVVDIGLNNFLFVVPLVALGAPAPVFTLWIIASSVHGLCQHANMKIRCGPLNWVFSMAELHRWHHSRLVRESNTNYGQTLILWDIVFGSRFLPDDREPPDDIGIANLDAFPMTWWAQMLSPFHWARIKRESAGGS